MDRSLTDSVARPDDSCPGVICPFCDGLGREDDDGALPCAFCRGLGHIDEEIAAADRFVPEPPRTRRDFARTRAALWWVFVPGWPLIGFIYLHFIRPHMGI